MGSCEDYDTRKAIDREQLMELDYDAVTQEFGNTLVIVGSLDLRYRTLIPEHIYMPDITDIDYCILERVGRARDNGMSAVGKNHLSPLVPDARSMFHRRKMLADHGLIYSELTSAVMGVSHVSILYLPRFKVRKAELRDLILERLKNAIQETPNGLISSKAQQIFLDFTEGTEFKWKAFRKRLPKSFCWQRGPAGTKSKNSFLMYKGESQVAKPPKGEKEAKQPFLNLSNQYFKASQENQILLVIEEAGPQGLRASELPQVLGMDSLSVRSHTKVLLKNNRIFEVKQQIQKCLAISLVASIYKENQTKLKVSPPKLFKGPSITEKIPYELTLVDVYGETTEVRVEYTPAQDSQVKMDNDVRIRRVNMINEIIIELGICSNLYSIVTLARQRDGSLMCSKTVKRIIHYLVENGSVGYYQATFKRGTITKTISLICDRAKYNIESEKFQALLRTIHKKMIPVVSAKLDPLPAKESHTKLVKRDKRLFDFAALKEFHKFLVYLAWLSATERTPIEDVPPLWQQKLGEGENLRPVYHTELGWKTFLPPRPSCNGWLTIKDILTHIPLQMFRDHYTQLETMINVPEYLKNPIKRYFMMSQCPTIDVQHHMWCQDALVKTLHRLCFIGLVRFGKVEAPKNASNLLHISVYLNRHATVADTITMEFNEVLPDIEYKKSHYEFTNEQAVQSYWEELTRVGMNTSLPRKIQFGYSNAMEELKQWVNPLSREEIEQSDDGSLPGDGRGVAGLHSNLMAHQYRFWDVSYKPGVFSSKPLVKAFNKKKKKVIGSVTQVAVKPKRIYPKVYDDVDVQAKATVLYRTKWTHAEDTALLLGRLANLYLSATPRNVQFISALTYRDVLHFMCLSLDKSAKMCSRRVQFLTKNDVTKTTIQSCLKEMSHTKAITNRWGPNFLSKLREEYPNEEEFLSALKIHFVELVKILSGMFSKFTSNTFLKHAQTTLPDTMEEFEERFEIKQMDPMVEWTDLDPEDEIKVHAVYNTIHSSMCCSRDSSSDSLILLDIYKNFPEEILVTAMTRASSTQLITKWKINYVQSKRTIPLNTKPFHLSAYYTRYFIMNISNQIVDNISRWVDEVRSGNENFTGNNRCFHFFHLGLDYRNAINLTIRSQDEIEGSNAKQEANSKRGRDKKKSVAFNDDVKIKDFEYQSTEILLKVNPINWHILCFLKETIGKSANAQKKIVIEEDTCNFSCFVNKLHDFHEAREFLTGINVKEFKEGIRQVLNDLVAEKEKMVSANKKDLGNVQHLKRSKKKFFDLLVDLSQDNYSPLNRMVTEIRLKEGTLFPRPNRMAEIKRKLLTWGVISKEPKKEIKTLFDDHLPVESLLKFIKGFGSAGVSGTDLVAYFGQATKLESIIRVLIENHWILVCGIEDIQFVHRDCGESWLVKSVEVLNETEQETTTDMSSRLLLRRSDGEGPIDPPPVKKAKILYHDSDTPTDYSTDIKDKKPVILRMYPWIRVTGTLNQRVVDKVVSTILLYLQKNSGITYSDLLSRFKIFHPAHLKLLLWLMEDMGYVKIFKCRAHAVSLLSTPESPEVGKKCCEFKIL